MRRGLGRIDQNITTNQQGKGEGPKECEVVRGKCAHSHAHFSPFVLYLPFMVRFLPSMVHGSVSPFLSLSLLT